ncbi:DMT family transporter [Christiangramia flava]|uniref:Permease of the drug/metabolite transporter (DMT) superfamily n=1 Tax=Christiangramia flava JLT2011 TaxID=1229726 RepID=A0A1L7I4E5_9FLAO|nr:DMT family transporter [Christiangramia flava]APU68466.1 Permease of the drug/metabolite transporter (DMT) superfamily [Christiangramia flava JLT2011]OSS40746.1 Permease of the drug/metabolite transporter (DMT) superfamily [Christiangramia flava JLT2011]
MAAGKLKWIYLVFLSLVWGSSFILIKKSLVGLDAYQVGSFRIIFAAIFLIIVGFRRIMKLNARQWKWIVISGFLGSFFPVYLFSFAETEIDSAIASILNATTPLMTLIFGALFFRSVFSQNKIIGVVIGLLGTAGLILSGASVNPDQNYVYSLLVVLAASCYAFNVNILKTKMADISPLGIAAGNFASLLLPAVLILFFSGFFEQQLTSEIETSLVFVAILGIVGTGIAMIIFNKLVQISDPVFTTSVTYTIPIVALGWGILDGEIFSSWQLLSALVILVGVFIVNRSRNLIALKKKFGA